MFVLIPSSLTAKILKHKDINKAIMFFSTRKTFILKDLLQIGLRRKIAKSILKELVFTEHLEKEKSAR